MAVRTAGRIGGRGMGRVGGNGSRAQAASVALSRRRERSASANPSSILGLWLPVIGLVTFGALIYVATYAKLTHTEYMRQRLEVQYKKALAENRRLLLQTGERCALSRVTTLAQEELHMRPCRPEEVELLEPARRGADQTAGPTRAVELSQRCREWSQQVVRVALERARGERQVASREPD